MPPRAEQCLARTGFSSWDPEEAGFAQQSPRRAQCHGQNRLLNGLVHSGEEGSNAEPKKYNNVTNVVIIIKYFFFFPTAV